MNTYRLKGRLHWHRLCGLEPIAQNLEHPNKVIDVLC
jgi:hypothetical protein